MNRVKEILFTVLANLLNILIISFLLTLFFFPYTKAGAHQYFYYKQYNTIITYFCNLFNQFLLISCITVFLIFMLKKLIRANIKTRLDERKGKISTVMGKFFLYLLTVAVIYSVLLVSALLFLQDEVRASLMVDSFEIYLAIFTLGVFVLFFFLNPGELLKNIYYKIGSTLVVIFFIFINLTSYFNYKHEGPNLVIIAINSLRADIAAMGKDNNKNMPKLAELKKDCITFTNFRANTSRTLPSLASMITSLYPSKLNMSGFDSLLENRVLTLTELLKNEGYHTCGVVSNIFLGEKYGMAQGFDVYYERVNSGQNFNLFNTSSPQISKKAIDYLKGIKDRKFFLFLHYDDPSLPYFNQDKDLAYEGGFVHGTSLETMSDLIRNQKYSQDDIYYLKRCYKSEINYTDRYIGQVLEELKKNNLYDNTLIVVTSGHGEEFMERGFLGHGTSVYDEQIAVPLLLKLPGQEKPAVSRQIKTPFSLIDLMPTITNLLKINNPQEVQGEDMLGNLAKGTVIFCEVKNSLSGSKNNALALLKDNYKLISFPDTGKFEIFDLSSDPFETHNLSKTEIIRLEEMKKQLKRWILVNRSKKLPGSKVNLSEEEKKVLKSLGYYTH